MNQTLTIVVAQCNFLLGDIAGNAERIIQASRCASQKWAADLVVFPELALTGYPPEDLLFRPGFHQDCQKALAHIQKNTPHTNIIFGYPQKVGGQIFNQAAWLAQGEIKATYAKQKLPNYAVFDEKRYFYPGHSPSIVDFKGVKIGLLICEDIWHPSPAKQAVQYGAQLLIVINASPFERAQAYSREKVLRRRSKEVQTPIIYANLVGGQDELVFDGGSMVFNAQGERCQQAPYFSETFMPVTIELEGQSSAIPIASHPLPPRHSEEENIYQAICLGVQDYIKKNHLTRVIIGVSGGIDSALTLAIAVDALGAENVQAVMMPSRYTQLMSIQDAAQQAKTLGVCYEVIDIEPTFQAVAQSLAPQFQGLPPDTTEENIQARIRGLFLMALANKRKAIVLPTGNKSELAVGYATLYGDMAGSFAPLKDVFKTLVYRLAHYRNSISPVIPSRVLDRPPSAELAEGQLDEDSLPPYPILDEILHQYIELDRSTSEIVQAGFDPIIVKKVVKMVNFNEFKRRQGCIGVRITSRAFGKDRRYPITSAYDQH